MAVSLGGRKNIGRPPGPPSAGPSRDKDRLRKKLESQFERDRVKSRGRVSGPPTPTSTPTPGTTPTPSPTRRQPTTPTNLPNVGSARPPVTPGPPGPVPSQIPTFPESLAREHAQRRSDSETRKLRFIQERQTAYEDIYPSYIKTLSEVLMEGAVDGKLGDSFIVNPEPINGIEFSPGIYLKTDARKSKGFPTRVDAILTRRLLGASEEDNFDFMGDVALLHEALGYIDIGPVDPATGFPEITERIIPKDPNWDLVGEYLDIFATTNRSLIAPQKGDVISSLATLSIGALFGGPIGVGLATPFVFPELIPEPIKQGLGAARRWEVGVFGTRMEAFARKMKVPEIALPFVRELAVPSTVIVAAVGKTPLTKGASFAQASTIGKSGRYFREGALFGSGDVTYIAYGEGRDPTPNELAMGMVLGGVGEAALAGFLPVLARTTGGTIRVMPGGRRFLEITGRQLNTADSAIKKAILEFSTITRVDFDNLLSNVRILRKKDLPPVRGIDPAEEALGAARTARLSKVEKSALDKAGGANTALAADLDISDTRKAFGLKDNDPGALSGREYTDLKKKFEDDLQLDNGVRVFDEKGRNETVVLGGSAFGDREGLFLLHGTSSKRVVSITSDPAKGGGLKVAQAGESSTDALPGLHMSIDYDQAVDFSVVQARLDDEVLGNVLLYKVRDGVRLINRDGPEWEKLIGEFRGNRTTEGLTPAQVVERLQNEGYGGTFTRGKTEGKFKTQERYVIFNEDDVQFVANVVDSDPTRAADQVTAMMTGRFKTASELTVGLDFDQVFRAADDLAQSTAQIPPGTHKNISQGATGIVTESGPIAGSGADRLLNDLSAALPDPKWKRLIERVTNDELDKSVLVEALMRTVDRPLPSGMFSSVFNKMRSVFFLQPGLRMVTRSSFLIQNFYRETLGEYINSHSLALMQVLKGAFGTEVLKNPRVKIAGIQYTGPKVTDRVMGDVIGTISDVIERPEFYLNLSPEMRRAARIWDAFMEKDIRLALASGMDIEAITTRVYVPHVVGDDVSSSLLNKIQEELKKLTSDQRLTGKIAPGGKGAFARRRKYPTIFEFAEVLGRNGLDVELDPMALFVRRLTGGGNSRSNAIYIKGVLAVHGRFDTTPGANARFGERVVEYPVLLNTKEIAAAGHLTGKVPKKTLVGKGDGRWFLPEDIANEVTEISRSVTRPAEIGLAEEVLDTMRSTLLSVDLSFVTIQGYSLAAADPVRFFTQMGEIAPALMSREGHMLWMAGNAHRLQRFTQAGGTLYNSVLDVPSGRNLGGGKVHPIDKVPIAGWLNDVGFNRLLPAMKLYTFETSFDLLKNLRDGTRAAAAFERLHPKLKGVGAEIDNLLDGIPVYKQILEKLGGVKGKTDFELERIAADVTNNIGGGINWAIVGRSPGLMSKGFILTEGWTRAKIGLIVQAAHVGHPAGVLARRMLIQQVGIVAVFATAISLWRTGELPSYDPNSTDFLDVRLETGRVPILPGKTAIRAVFRGIQGQPWDTEDSGLEQRIASVLSYGEGRAGQVPRTLVDLKTGKDYFGRKIDDKMLHVMQSMLPIVFGEAWRSVQEGVQGWELAKRLGIESLGLNFIPTSPYDHRDTRISTAEVWRASGQPFRDFAGNIILEYRELNPGQKTEYGVYDESLNGPGYNADIQRDLELRESPYAIFDAIDKSHARMIKVAGELLSAENGIPETARQYRNRISAIGVSHRISRAIVFQQNNLNESEPRTIDQVVYDGYFEEVIERAIDPAMRAALGSLDSPLSMEAVLKDLSLQIDGDLFESLERNYFAVVRSTHGQAAVDKIQGWLGFKDYEDQVATAYRRDREILDVGYYATLDEIFTPELLAKHGGLPDATREFNTWEEYISDSSTKMYEQLLGKPMPPELGNEENRDGTTWYELFAIDTTTPLNQQQTRELVELVTNKVFKDFDNFRREVGTAYLKLHPEEICIMGYWETGPGFNQELLAYAQLCGSDSYHSFK